MCSRNLGAVSFAACATIASSKRYYPEAASSFVADCEASWGVTMRKALVTGIAGQDGTYLAEFLLESGYEIYGADNDAVGLAETEALIKEGSHSERLFLHLADSTELSELNEVVRRTRPTEIYNLSARTRVDHSFIEPFATTQSVAVGTANLLHAVRVITLTPASFKRRVQRRSAPRQLHKTRTALSRRLAHMVVQKYMLTTWPLPIGAHMTCTSAQESFSTTSHLGVRRVWRDWPWFGTRFDHGVALEHFREILRREREDVVDEFPG